jgi:hypothetical protein
MPGPPTSAVGFGQVLDSDCRQVVRVVKELYRGAPFRAGYSGRPGSATALGGARTSTAVSRITGTPSARPSAPGIGQLPHRRRWASRCRRAPSKAHVVVPVADYDARVKGAYRDDGSVRRLGYRFIRRAR